MDYAPNTPEYRVAELARQGSGKTAEEVLQASGWVPHDGTWQRDELLAQYAREAPFCDRTAQGIALHAADWAYNGMRSDLATAQDYGRHMEAMWRRGEMDAATSHKTEYPAFLAEREAEIDREAEASDYIDPLERHAIDGPHFYDLEA